MSRDEDAWRAADAGNPQRREPSKRGGRLSTNAFKAALTSWQNAVLFVSKALLHWLLGQSISPSLEYMPNSAYGISDTGISHYYQFDMIYMRIFAFSIVATFLAIFTTYLALRRPKGPQPTAWGHFQTLADLIDDWNFDKNGGLWWGDKGMNADGVRHAGTSGNRDVLGNILMDSQYA
jgi:hypothetical protein